MKNTNDPTAQDRKWVTCCEPAYFLTFTCNTLHVFEIKPNDSDMGGSLIGSLLVARAYGVCNPSEEVMDVAAGADGAVTITALTASVGYLGITERDEMKSKDDEQVAETGAQ